MIIGIDEYKYEGYTNLGAAVARQATRKGITDRFKNLIHNPTISPGMSVIIYYAGHGALAPKSKEWTNWQTPDNQIQMLCPTDMRVLDVNKKVVEGIPDRTISKLLRELVTAKGNNIVCVVTLEYSQDETHSCLDTDPQLLLCR